MKKVLFKKNLLVDTIGKTYYFKMILILSFAVAYYGTNVLGNNGGTDIFSILLYSHSINYFNVMVFLLIFLNTLNSFYVVKQNYNYLIRIEDKKKYIKILIKTIFLVNIIWIFLFLMMFIVITLFGYVEFINLNTISYYKINIMCYTLFYLVRYYAIGLLFSMIFGLLLNKLEEKVVYFLFFIFELGLLFTVADSNPLNSLLVFPFKYFNMSLFNSFYLEICSSFIFFVILYFIFMIFYKCVSSNYKIKVRELYFFYNDFEYFIKKNKITILLFLFTPAVLSFSSSKLDSTNILEISLGLNVIEKFNIISFISFLTNVFFCSYFFIQSFIKDYSNVVNIYCRYNHKKYFYIKSIINIIILFIFKSVQYILLILCVRFIFNKELINILGLFVNDFSFIIFICFVVLFIYILYKVISRFKFIFYLCLLLLFVIFIYKLTFICINKFIFYIIGSVFVIVIGNFFIVKNNKKVIQNIGGI